MKPGTSKTKRGGFANSKMVGTPAVSKGKLSTPLPASKLGWVAAGAGLATRAIAKARARARSGWATG